MSKLLSVLVIAVALCFSCLNAADDRPEGTPECLAKSGALEADVFARPRKYSQEIHCFWKCMLERSNMLDAAGVVNVDLFEKAFPKAAVNMQPQQITDIKKCLATIGKIVICDDMSKVRECFVKVLKS
ncbi:uncharacterized protein LOC126881107 isoform X1 [Diabrotica virgifera virgifera]|uniref:Uncharacterized protein n=1 Tax=Diabrotica virgifera virgifera TaxID=50390 RepID=A0ABM5JT45_DIAVI|nr:uncharacterized protein LOC126881107 isoform X1 [Diabrotica virgifera virgifera]